MLNSPLTERMRPTNSLEQRILNLYERFFRTISKFTEVKNLNQKLFVTSQENRVRFEQELVATKNYIAWNELRQDEINRKVQVLLDN